MRRSLLLLLLGLSPAVATAQVYPEDAVVINEFTVNPTTGREYVELLVTAPQADLRRWTLSDRSLTGTPGNTEGSIILPNDAYLSAVPQGTYVVIELATPTANASLLTEDLSLSDGTPKRLIIKPTTAGVQTDGGTLDNATADNLVLFSGSFSDTGSGIVDQVLVGTNTSSLFPGATWGDNNATTTTDNVNGGTAVASNTAVRFVPAAATFPDGFRANDTGSAFQVDASSYGTPGERNTGVATAINADAIARNARFVLLGAQPAPEARLQLRADVSGPVQVRAYDALGREVAVLFDGTLAAGDAQTFTLGGLPAGVYVVRALGTQVSASRTVVLR